MSGKMHSSVECVTCSESNPSCFFKPCNHKCICPKCAKKYYIGKSEKQTCPICRQPYCAIGHDDSKPKNQSMDEDEQLAIALRISLQESLEQEAKRKLLEESDANRQDNPAVVDLRIKQESELLEHKRILSSIVDLVSREASKIEMGLLQSFPVDIRGAQFAREETELRMIQNVENAFSRIKESIKLRRSIQMDLWKECPESLQKLTGQTGIQVPIKEINRPTGFNPLENVRSPQGSSNEGVSSTQSSQAASSTEKSYANLVKTSPIKTRPASEMSKTSSMSDLRLVRGVSTEALSFQPLASITFNEIIDVIVTDEDESYMHVRPHGFMSLYLPSKLAMSIAVTDKRMQKFTFQVRKSDFIENFIISDGLLTELRNPTGKEENSVCFSIEQNNFISFLQKEIEDAPTRPHYRVTVARYEIERRLINIDSLPVQLNLKVAKKKSGKSILAECSIKYRCNFTSHGPGTRLQNVQISLYSDVDFSTLHSQPPSRKLPGWPSSVLWHHAGIEGNSQGEMKATLDFSNLMEPSQIVVEFNCEGFNLHGVEFQLHPHNQLHIQRVLRKFKLKKQFQCSRYPR